VPGVVASTKRVPVHRGRTSLRRTRRRASTPTARSCGRGAFDLCTPPLKAARLPHGVPRPPCPLTESPPPRAPLHEAHPQHGQGTVLRAGPKPMRLQTHRAAASATSAWCGHTARRECGAGCLAQRGSGGGRTNEAGTAGGCPSLRRHAVRQSTAMSRKARPAESATSRVTARRRAPRSKAPRIALTAQG
jgi:hypothetical protein